MIRTIAFCALLASSAWVQSKPIAFQDGYTLMGEYGTPTMQEIQGFYAPRYFYSVGGGFLTLKDTGETYQRDITYARANWLAKRWNMPGAQANIFVWGGVGSADLDPINRTETAWNYGFQTDYETRKVYVALRSDVHKGKSFINRSETLQLGWAPYEHDWDVLATWLLFQVRDSHDKQFEGLETAYMLRFFKGGAWVEAGITDRGELQAMFMFNY